MAAACGKLRLLSSAAAIRLAPSHSVTITKFHAPAVQRSGSTSETVVITAADKPTLQKAVDALVAAGYFGVSNDPAIMVDAGPAVKDATVKSLNVTGVHLCCKKCVSAVNTAVGKVPGVTGTTAVKGAESFEVTGEFSTKAVIEALHEEGLSGKAGN